MSGFIIIAFVILVVSNKDALAAKKYNYVGCYETADRSKILYQHLKKIDKLTPKSCVDWCHSKHSTYAGVQKNECRCGQYQPTEMMRRPYRDCGHPCPGDRNTKCGSENRISIFETALNSTGDKVIPARSYLGCYPDNDTDHRILKGSTYEFPDNTPKKCHHICYQHGFRYLGLSDVKYCYCGDTAPSKDNAISSENCKFICNGDETKYCGGYRKLSLYATGITNIPEFGRYVGCYDNANLKDIKSEFTLNLPLTNSQGRCLNICDQKEYKYAGVQGGALCTCFNQAPSVTFIKDDEDCNDMACPGELTNEYCGSNDVMAVFRTRRTDEIQAIQSDYQGCYKDQKDFHTLDGYKETFEKNLTPKLCVETCRFKGFAFSGVESGVECYCSHSYPTIYAKVTNAECNIPCSGNSKERCGGQSRIGVYDTGIPHPQVFVDKFYMGCYKDDVLGIKLLEGTSNDMVGYLSPIVCYKKCMLSGFLYFGLITTSDEIEKCLCSDVDPDESLLADESECQKKCSGDSNKVCGSDWRVATYRTGLSDIQSKYMYKGCYKNDEYVLIDRRTDHSDTLTPRRCYRLCDMLGFIYFGLEQGKICRCGNDLSSSRESKSEDNCYIRCPGNALETCGGHNKYIQIYQIISNIGNKEDTQDRLSEETNSFIENFNTLDNSVWSYSIKFAHEPDFEFVTYERNNQVVFLRDGKLFIKPKIQSNKYTQSSITLQNCTGKPIECSKKAQNFYILPPIQSGQLTTKHSFSFLYGTIEVRTKLPIGDWIVPEIWLKPTKQEYGDYYQSGQIRIAMTRGNKQFDCFNKHYGYKRIEMGVYLGNEVDVKQKVFYKMTNDSWINEFHNYAVIWTPEKIIFQVDNEEIGRIHPKSGETIRQIVGLPESTEYLYVKSANKLAPFDKEFYITFGVSVGGLTDFSDDCSSNPQKPWSNTSPKAMLNFWKAKDQWSNTWVGDNTALQIDHVIVRRS